jgi:hypothetical protein
MPSLVTPMRAGAGALFGSLARITGSRPLHPLGVAFTASLSVDDAALPGTRLFGRPAAWDARIRFSRGFGLPDPLPEILSVAIKVPDAYGAGRDHDLLLTATGRRPVVRHLFVPGRSHLDRFYSSVLPFTAGGEAVFFGAAPRDTAPVPGGDLDELVATAARHALELELLVATATSPWRRIGSVRAGRRLTDEEESALAFNSDSTGGGIAPAGAINRIRGGAYAAAGQARPPGASATRPARVQTRARSR